MKARLRESLLMSATMVGMCSTVIPPMEAMMSSSTTAISKIRISVGQSRSIWMISLRMMAVMRLSDIGLQR